MTRKRHERPDLDKIFGQLKDFQRDTVEHVFRRFYLDDPPAHRYLVADEVGLGKTLVAKGVIAKAIDHLWDRVPRIDIVYICSNLDIARQNVDRMKVMGRDDFALASRITMLPTLTHQIAQNKFNFVSFTPDTSFELGQTAGRREERHLLYHLLQRAWEVRGAGVMNLLQGAVRDAERFRRDLRQYLQFNEIDESLAEAFAASLEDKIRDARGRGEEDLRTRFETLCKDFGRARSTIPLEDRRRQNALIGELRAVLARTCIRALEPDLVILDEFQRFKSLLDGGDEASLLAKELFDYEHQDGRARVMLLSATPYKMYTTPDGASDDDHYADFLQTLKFLQDDPAASDRVRGILERYRRLLLKLGPDTQLELAELKATLEDELRRVMVRTERLAASEDRNGMLREVPAAVPRLEPRTVRTYHTLQRLARAVEHSDTLEYWKAAPYLLNFMQDYKFKQGLDELIEADDEVVLEALESDRSLVLDRGVVRGKKALDPPHPRLKWLMDQTIGADLWKLLWLPPSLPYYELGQPFAEPARRGVTKRLVFSAWRVVPRTIAALLSYEAERRMLEQASTERRSLDDARNRVVPLLRFTRTEGRLTGMPVLGLVYPSFALASLGDPLDPYFRLSGGRAPSQAALLGAIKARIKPLLDPIVADRAKTRGPVDESWYWAAPMLLDLVGDRKVARRWMEREELAAKWIGADGTEEGDGAEGSLWEEHVEEALRVLESQKLGPAPEDLLDVVAMMALAGPAVTALRAISRFTGGESAQQRDYVRDAAGSVAWGIRNLFNLPDSIGLVRALFPGEPYWQRVLDYSAAGGLQAVLDEYIHILPESLGLIGHEPDEVASKVARELRLALGLRTAQVAVDDLRVGAGGAIERDQKRMRARFAVRFGESEADVDGDRPSRNGDARTRSGQLRTAFNSPFWPFVLATTTVGQEGLDFHQYCHAVVHWNLPSNPVDLEQREGRVHRFKGHAVRKNVARKYGRDFLSALEVGEEEPGRAGFDIAHDNRAPGTSDIVPYWVFPLDGGAAVERHVPALPLSEDLERLDGLRRTLAVYRMVFGQPRQDELLEYLMRRMGREEAVGYLAELRIDLSPVRP